LALLASDGLDVVVGGLGLGYTARAALEDSRVQSLTVVDALAEVNRDATNTVYTARAN